MKSLIYLSLSTLPYILAQDAVGSIYVDGSPGDPSASDELAQALFNDSNQNEYADNNFTQEADDDEEDTDGQLSQAVYISKTEADQLSQLTSIEMLTGAEDEDEELTDSGRRMVDLLKSQLGVVLSEATDKKSEKVKVSSQYLDAVAEASTASEMEQVAAGPGGLLRAIGGGRSTKKSCKSASTGKRTKKNKGCDAVLPINLNYGCWCHADNTDIFKGKGQHMDEFDKACKMYKQCLRCVRHDSRSNGEVCDPGTQKYFTENSRSKDGIHAECSSNNESNCAINTCCCEVEYVRTILKLFMIDGVKLNRKRYHSSNHFDYDSQCEAKGTGGDVECCGHYPHRRMYNTHSRQCCENNTVFDPYTHVCCDDGDTARSIEECNDPNRNNKRKKRAISNNLQNHLNRKSKSYMKQHR